MAVAESVIDLFLQKLRDPLSQEAIFLHDVHDPVKRLEAEFRHLLSFLEDADAKQEGNEEVKKWVQELKDVAYDAEDLIDTFVFKIATLKRIVFVGGFIRRYAFIFNELLVHREVGLKIEGIKNKIHEIYQKKLDCGIENRCRGAGTSSAGLSLQDWREVSLAREPDFVGFGKDLETLVVRLTEGELRRCVFSVVGMGGLGKTTLTKKVYNDTRVERHFQSRAWIYISQEYGVRVLLLNIIDCYMELSKEELKVVKMMDVNELRHKISEYLKEKRYLMVLDDIWTYEAWDALKDAFPDMNNGSRVLLTTRNKNVALYADAGTSPHELQFLNEEESWVLFRRKAVTGSCPQDLQLGRRIMGKCRGLPLAIVAIGQLLSRKELSEWENVSKSISGQLFRGEFDFSSILSLSYKDLPHHLKPCFLYLAIFPEDYEFHAKKLIQLWAAEGLLKGRGDQTVEEVGQNCLRELIHRSMIQLDKRSSSGGIKSFRVHSLMHDLSKSLAEKGDFLSISVENPSHETSLTISTDNRRHETRPRRLALHFHSNPSASPNISSIPHLRSLLCFHMVSQLLPFKVFKLLRVLDLEGALVTEWPDSIGQLIHLRYLGLRKTRLRKIPPSARNLRNLLTLDVKSTSIDKLPDAIGEMKELRHLHANRYIANSRIIESLINIQTVPMMQADAWMEEGLGKLTNLRKLGISGDLSFCDKALSRLSKLRSLRVAFSLGNTVLDLTSLPGNLVKLHLELRIEKLPKVNQLPQNLRKLSLRWSLLEEDPLATLEKLQNLQILLLGRGSFVGKKMVCSQEGFPRLEFLKLDYLNDLEEWRVEEGALQRLNHLVVQSCRRLKMLPQGLEHVTTLNRLESSLMPDEFKARLQEDKGEDWYKIRRISTVDIK